MLWTVYILRRFNGAPRERADILASARTGTLLVSRIRPTTIDLCAHLKDERGRDLVEPLEHPHLTGSDARRLVLTGMTRHSAQTWWCAAALTSFGDGAPPDAPQDFT